MQGSEKRDTPEVLESGTMPRAGERRTKKAIGVYRNAKAGDGRLEKSAVNGWLAELATVKSQPGWSLLLETRELQTLEALRSRGADSAASKVVVPNPDPEECQAMRAAAPGLHVHQCTSHELISDLARGGEASRGLQRAGWTGFHFVWLDYCGTLSSSAGRRRQSDVQQLLPFLDVGGVLAITLSQRGAVHLYEGEVVDTLVVCVRSAALAVGRMLSLCGVAHYRAPSKMMTACFQLDEPAAIAETPGAPNLDFVSGANFRLGLGFRDGLERPCGKAWRLVAEAFAAAAGRARSFVLESNKLLTVTRALELAGQPPKVTCLLDPMETAVAQALLGTALVTCWAKSMRGLDVQCLDAVWIGCEGRACTAQELRACDWAHLGDILSRGVVHPRALVAVSIARASTAEIWEGSAADWVARGMREACRKHGYEVTSVAVICFHSNAPRLIVMCRLGGCKDAPVLAPCLESCEISGWSFHTFWDETRVKVPTASATRLQKIAPYFFAVCRATQGRALLHEPGFFVFLPGLRRSFSVLCCAGCDDVVFEELGRRGAEVVHGPPQDGDGGDFDKLFVLDDCGPAAWRTRWAATVHAWLACRRLHPTTAVLGILFEASDPTALPKLLVELLQVAGPRATVHSATHFVHGSRRWATAAVVVDGGGDASVDLCLTPRQVLPGCPVTASTP